MSLLSTSLVTWTDAHALGFLLLTTLTPFLWLSISSLSVVIALGWQMSRWQYRLWDLAKYYSIPFVLLPWENAPSVLCNVIDDIKGIQLLKLCQMLCMSTSLSEQHFPARNDFNHDNNPFHSCMENKYKMMVIVAAVVVVMMVYFNTPTIPPMFPHRSSFPFLYTSCAASIFHVRPTCTTTLSQSSRQNNMLKIKLTNYRRMHYCCVFFNFNLNLLFH